MTSTNEELHLPQLKARNSPLEFQNADLVSRLLAATPPYLYNMPVMPHSFFFSEMLRSLVHAKTLDGNNQRQQQQQRDHPVVNQQKRHQRKRSWTQAHSGECHKHIDTAQSSWNKTFLEKTKLHEDKLMDKLHYFSESTNEKLDPSINGKNNEFLPSPPGMNIPPTLPNATTTALDQTSYTMSDVQQVPMNPWYPSLYSNAYGIDPLHFFIDLRVSGHIYDKKNNTNKEIPSNVPEKSAFPESENLQESRSFKQTRHTSAFSVPKSVLNKNFPINLTHYSSQNSNNNSISNNGHRLTSETKTKFDVKSLGFDRNVNEIGTSYVMKNVSEIYKKVSVAKIETESVGSEQQEQINVTDNEKDSISSKIQSEDDGNSTEEEKERKVSDIQALIGLELVVDYMNHSKTNKNHQERNRQDFTPDVRTCESPALDVVDVNDDGETVY